MPQAKFRPSLTAEQIQWLIEHCKQAAGDDHVALELLITLAPFKAKIDAGGIKPAYIAQPKQTLLQQLGDTTSPSYVLRGVAYETKEAYWEACYTYWLKLQTPDFTDGVGVASLADAKAIEAGAKEHRYLNGLMTDLEVAEFEQQAFLSSTGD